MCAWCALIGVTFLPQHSIGRPQQAVLTGAANPMMQNWALMNLRAQQQLAASNPAYQQLLRQQQYLARVQQNLLMQGHPFLQVQLQQGATRGSNATAATASLGQPSLGQATVLGQATALGQASSGQVISTVTASGDSVHQMYRVAEQSVSSNGLPGGQAVDQSQRGLHRLKLN